MQNSPWTKLLKNKYFRFFSSVKFAIPILFLFALGMILGTLAESRFGTTYAGRLIYHSWWFYAIQGGIALSLFLAMLARLPIQRRLYGFYTVHISLLVLFLGSTVTHLYGVDGTLQLSKGQPNSSLHLSESMAYVSIADKLKSIPLPNALDPVEIGQSLELPGGIKIRFGRYIPFSKEVDAWAPKPGAWVSRWRLKNDRFEQEVQIGNELGGLVDKSMDLGPLHIEVMAESLTRELSALLSKPHHGYVLLNLKNGLVRPIDDLKKGIIFNEDGLHGQIRLSENKKVKMTFFEFILGDKRMAFFPRFSSMPLAGHLEIDNTSDYRLLNTEDFGHKNTVYLSPLADGSIRLVIGKDTSWQTLQISTKSVEASLPWMGFKMSLLEDRREQARELLYDVGTANKEDEKNISALSATIELNGKSEHLWLNNREPTKSGLVGADLFIGAQQFQLPFSMNLDHFEMKMIKGTDRPASYESFVNIVDDRPHQAVAQGSAQNPVHIFMNNPYKSDGFTFYQSSYFQDQNGDFHSILSVNKDPGRPIKYAGALLLILGLTLHFLIIYGKIKP